MVTHIYDHAHVITPEGIFPAVPEQDLDYWRSQLGEYVSLAPNDAHSFPPGPYQLRLFQDDFSGGYRRRVMVHLRSHDNDLTIAASQFLASNPKVVTAPRRWAFWRRH